MRNRQHSNRTPWRSRHTRAASNIIGMALALAITLGIAGSLAYFMTQQTNVLTTQEGMSLTGPRLLKAGDANVLSVSIKNTGTSPLNNPKIVLTDACKDGTSRLDVEIDTKPSDTSKTTTIKPGATYGVSEQLETTHCKGETTGREVDIEAGTSYVMHVSSTAAGTDSSIIETVTVTSRY